MNDEEKRLLCLLDPQDKILIAGDQIHSFLIKRTQMSVFKSFF